MTKCSTLFLLGKVSGAPTTIVGRAGKVQPPAPGQLIVAGCHALSACILLSNLSIHYDFLSNQMMPCMVMPLPHHSAPTMFFG